MAMKKYIYPYREGYRIVKTIKQKTITYGYYPTVQQAQKVRDTLIVHNWNPQYAKIQLKQRKKEDRYIYKYKQKTYYIRKVNPITKKQETYECGIQTLEEARKIRDWWEDNNWDWEMIDNG